jgi:eukaryotic-like serine/threonine-protein kinase
MPSPITPVIDETLRAGDQVGEYVIQERLGEGGFGTVYKAVHPIIKKKAAIKVLHRAMSSNPKIVSRFISEARAVNEIGHHNIIDIFGFGVTPSGQHYYTMAFLEGETLEQALRARKYSDLHSALPILRQIGQALDAAHQRGIVHRDLKPANVMIGTGSAGEPVVKLLDFGIAKLLTEDDEARPHKTRTGAPIGTPQYMSPEQAKGRTVDHRTDIYAFGVVVYEMLTGSRPFEGDSPVDTMLKHVSQAPTPPSTIRSGLPPAVDAIVMRAMEKEPQDRPGSMHEIVAVLDSARAGYAVTAEASASLDLIDRKRPQGSSVMLKLGIGLFVVALGVTFFVIGQKPAPLPLPPPPPPTVAIEEPPPPAPPPPAPPAEPETISVRVEGASEIEVFDRATGTKLGHVGRPILLQKSDAPRELEFCAKGFECEVRSIKPTTDVIMDVRLKRKATAPRKARTHQDLEKPVLQP